MNSIEKGSSLTFLALPVEPIQEHVGIYKFKNTKVKRALAFKSKWNKPVLA